MWNVEKLKWFIRTSKRLFSGIVTIYILLICKISYFFAYSCCLVLTKWFKQNKDEMEICYKRWFTVPFQIRSITDEIKPFKSGSVFTSPLRRRLSRHREKFRVDGLVTMLFATFLKPITVENKPGCHISFKKFTKLWI